MEIGVDESYQRLVCSGMYEITYVCRGGGYHYCRTLPPHPKRNSKGLYPLHRVVMENALGRSLTPQEHVHHIDGDRDNNEASNLVALTRSDHAKLHGKGRAVAAVAHRCQCGTRFTVAPSLSRLREKRSKTGKLHCSRKCGRTFAAK